MFKEHCYLFKSLLQISLLFSFLAFQLQTSAGLGDPFGLSLHASHLPTPTPKTMSIQDRLAIRNRYKQKAQGHSPVQLETPSTSSSVQWGLDSQWKELVCAVRSNLEAAFSWKLNGAVIDVETSEGTFEASRPEKNWSVLKVLVTDGKTGNYTCRAENSMGASERNIHLDIAEPPPLPKFICDSNPAEESILCQVVNLTEARLKYSSSYFDSHELSRIENVINGDEDVTSTISTSRPLLPVDEYILQIRIFRSCDPWMNVTSSEKSILMRRLRPGLQYRIRMATKTAAGVGTFTRPKIVSHL